MINLQMASQRFLAFFGLSDADHAERKVSKEYRTEIKDLANRRINRRFLNDSHNQAVLVVGEICNQVTETNPVLIYSKALEPRFYKEVLSNSKCHFEILLEEATGVGVIHSLPLAVRDRIQYRVGAYPGDGAHFIIAAHAFRTEIEEKTDEMFAVCNFFEPEAAEMLRKRFKFLWDDVLRPLKGS